jgi:hypothetical protein
MKEHWMTLTITAKMYGWTKWGGSRGGFVKEELDEWFCQVCGERQVQCLPSYMIPVDGMDRDFVRVCTLCKAKAKIEHIKSVGRLLGLVRQV